MHTSNLALLYLTETTGSRRRSEEYLGRSVAEPRASPTTHQSGRPLLDTRSQQRSDRDPPGRDTDHATAAWPPSKISVLPCSERTSWRRRRECSSEREISIRNDSSTRLMLANVYLRMGEAERLLEQLDAYLQECRTETGMTGPHACGPSFSKDCPNYRITEKRVRAEPFLSPLTDSARLAQGRQV